MLAFEPSHPPLVAPVGPDLQPESRGSGRRVGVFVAAAAILLLGLGLAAWQLVGRGDQPGSSSTVAESRASGAPSPATSSPTTAAEAGAEPLADAEPLVDAEPEPPVDAEAELEAEAELVAVADATPVDEIEPEVEAEPQRRRRGRRRRREPEPEVFEPEPEPEPEPVARQEPRPEPPSATELLRQAESALERGDAGEAYRLALRSHRARQSAKASAIMARAACRTGETEKAKQALKSVPLRDRSTIRRDCRQNGSRIGL
ncbi:MAG: hypothetical protein KDK70_36365 [Myxococcales bacterium]|nr:hypothetical protein [Myxococcales bacterium]